MVCHMRELTVSSTIIAPRGDQSLTPAMVAVVWEMASALDALRDAPQTVETALWLSIPTARLRGPDGRSDNVWLRACLRRLTKVYFEGEHQSGDPWGATLLAEWQIVEGGALARLLVPPAGIAALRAPETFAKVEAEAVHRLPGYARRLYLILADRKRQNRPNWRFELEELKHLLDVAHLKSYSRYNTFRERILAPAVAAINTFGTVKVTMTPERLGRSIVAVRFSWHWKSVAEAEATLEKNARARAARGEAQPTTSAPLRADEAAPTAAEIWWKSKDTDMRRAMASRLGYVRRSAGAPDLSDESSLAEPAWRKMRQMWAANAAPESHADADAEYPEAKKEEAPEG